MDEQKLRDHIQQLKNDRAAVKMTVLELESVHIDPLSSDSGNADAQRLDLENAVLMQELMAMKVCFTILHPQHFESPGAILREASDKFLSISNCKFDVKLTFQKCGQSRKTEFCTQWDFEGQSTKLVLITVSLVLLQEEKAELKSQNYLLEKEKSALELQLSGKQSQEQAYIVQIDHLKCEISEQQKRIAKSNGKVRISAFIRKVDVWIMNYLLACGFLLAHCLHPFYCLCAENGRRINTAFNKYRIWAIKHATK